MTQSLNVAMLPLKINWGDKETNIETLKSQLSLIHPDTDLVILPETFSTGFPSGKTKEEVRPMSERNTGNTIDLIKKLADEYSIAICGSFIAETGGSLSNRAFFIEPGGEESFADKRHLFTMAGENKVFSHGHDRLSVRFRGWNIAMIVCYDIRFPVWCRNTKQEYDLLVAIANWPSVRIGAWNTLLPARAIENSAYVCGVNCAGKDDAGFEYGGETAAYDFKGLPIGCRIEGSPVEYASLDYAKLEKFRTKFPVGNDADQFTLITE